MLRLDIPPPPAPDVPVNEGYGSPVALVVGAVLLVAVVVGVLAYLKKK